jgi:hypothetical protein
MSAARMINPNAVENLEFQLKASLRPVQPNPEFVTHLHRRLSAPPTILLERRSTALSLLLIALALMSGVFLIWWMRSLSKALPA